MTTPQTIEVNMEAAYTDTTEHDAGFPPHAHFGYSGGIALNGLHLGPNLFIPASELPAAMVNYLENWIGENE
jgi:hypothetical protein